MGAGLPTMKPCNRPASDARQAWGDVTMKLGHSAKSPVREKEIVSRRARGWVQSVIQRDVDPSLTSVEARPALRRSDDSPSPSRLAPLWRMGMHRFRVGA